MQGRPRDAMGVPMKRSAHGLALAFVVTLVGLPACDKAPPPAPAGPVAPTVVAPTGGAVAITADEKGFTPSEIHATKGAPLSLIFTRTSDNTCAKELVMPELKIRRPLPLNEAVAVQMPTQQEHTYRFQCGMAMWEGTIVIK